MEAFFRPSHTSNFVTCGFNKSYNQPAEVPSSRKPQRTAKRKTISASRPASFSISKFHIPDGLLGISGRKFQPAIQIDLQLRFTNGAPLS
jgi:hypothetical protein